MNHACYRRLSGASGHSTRSDGRLTGPGSIVDVNPVEADMAQPETLRQKAFAKLKLFNMNFSLNMNQCRWVEFRTVTSVYAEIEKFFIFKSQIQNFEYVHENHRILTD